MAYEVTVKKRGFKRLEKPVSVVINAGSDRVQSFSLEESPPSRQARFWAGFNEYSMQPFNQLLEAERNNQILRDFAAGAEVSLILKARCASPVGVEHLAASSTTTHTAAGGTATVIWDVPAIGLFVAPILMVGRAERFYVHPGYYFVGHWKSGAFGDRSWRSPQFEKFRPRSVCGGWSQPSHR